MGRKSNKSLPPKRKHTAGGMDGDLERDLETKRNKFPAENGSSGDKASSNNTKAQQKRKGKNHNKNRHKSKLVWVDRCVTNKPPKDPTRFAGIIQVKVTGVDLSDNHTHGGIKNRVELSDGKIQIESASISTENDLTEGTNRQSLENDVDDGRGKNNIDEITINKGEDLEGSIDVSDSDKKSEELMEVFECNGSISPRSQQPAQLEIGEHSSPNENKEKSPFVNVLRSKSASVKKVRFDLIKDLSILLMKN